MNLRNGLITLGLGASLWAPFGACADPYEESPGYVDFGDIRRFANGEETVEVFLAPPLLNLVTMIIEKEEPELASLIEELLLVKVDVFSFDGNDAGGLEAVADGVATELSGKGWQRLVKVQQRDERVLIYVLPTTEQRGDEERQLISGVVVVVLGGDALGIDFDDDDDGDGDGDTTARRRRRDRYDGNEAVFVNIVGSFDVGAIAELIHRFDVPHMRGHLRWDEDDWDEDDRDDEEPRRGGGR